MNLKILLARHIGNHLEREARRYRRALRDHLRQETSRIRKLEIRRRALRLYAAWAAKETPNVIHTYSDDWDQAALRRAAPEINTKTPAAA